jgi:hypothetical protein
MRSANSAILRCLRYFVFGTALALCAASCGSVGVSNGTATTNSSGGGEGVGNGTATLTWTPVTQTTDGAVLTDLVGYRVFYGLSASTMNNVAVLPDANITTYVVTNLSSGTWYFTVAAYTSSDTQGLTSNVCTKTIS